MSEIKRRKYLDPEECGEIVASAVDQAKKDERAKTIEACRQALRSCTYDGGSGGMISVQEADEAIKGVSDER